MRKIIEVQKPDVGTDYYVDSNGVFLASFTKDTPDDGVAEILGLPRDVPLATALTQAGISIATDQEPPPGGPWRFAGGRWVEIPKTAQQKRQAEFRALMNQGDQFDALIKLAVMTDAQKAAITPNKDAAPGTPEWLLGTVADIKTRNLKT